MKQYRQEELRGSLVALLKGGETIQWQIIKTQRRTISGLIGSHGKQTKSNLFHQKRTQKISKMTKTNKLVMGELRNQPPFYYVKGGVDGT
jgi:hypothetical protein